MQKRDGRSVEDLLRFRVWDKQTKSMWNIERWHIEDEYFDLIEPNKSVVDPNANRTWRKQSDVILMQSTGLLDKNGDDIFEGDVVEVFDSRYAVFYDNENASFRLKPRDKRWNTDYMSNYAHEASFEIIGNIYQNKELVEDK